MRQTKVLKPYHIVRQAKDHSIETMPQTKKYQMVFSKRVINPNTFKTYLYGLPSHFQSARPEQYWKSISFVKNNPARNRTPISRVTVEYTNRYTTES